MLSIRNVFTLNACTTKTTVRMLFWCILFIISQHVLPKRKKHKKALSIYCFMYLSSFRTFRQSSHWFLAMTNYLIYWKRNEMKWNETISTINDSTKFLICHLDYNLTLSATLHKSIGAFIELHWFIVQHLIIFNEQNYVARVYCCSTHRLSTYLFQLHQNSYTYAMCSKK